MLFDYEKYIKQSPYYSNIENTPEYKAFQKRQEERQKAATIGGAISSIFTAGLNFIPGVGPALSAGVGAVSGAAQNAAGSAGNAQASKELNKIQQDFKAQLPEGAQADTSVEAPKVDTGDGNMPNNFEKFLKLLQNPNKAKKQKAPQVAKAATTQELTQPVQSNITEGVDGELTDTGADLMRWLSPNSINNYLAEFPDLFFKNRLDYPPGASQQYTLQPISDITPMASNMEFTGSLAPSGNMDWSSGGFGMTEGFAKGGVMDTDEAPVLVTGGAPGTDTVALVDAQSGKDTGLRLDNGEMVVVSADNVQALQEAVANGDMFSVFSIVQDQLKQKPENGRMAEGAGEFNIEAERKKVAAGIAAAKKEAETKKKELELGSALSKYREAKRKYDELMSSPQAKQVGYSVEGDRTLGKTPDMSMYGEMTTDPAFWKEAEGYLAIMETEGKKAGLVKIPQAAPKKPAAKVAQKRKPVDIAQMTMEGAEAIQGFPLPQATFTGEVAVPDVPDLAQMESKSELRNELLANDFRRFLGKAKEKVPALQDLAGYGYDITRFITGMQAAGEELPAFSKPARFEDFMDRLEQQSYMGLTAPEMTSLQRGADRAMAYDVANIYNLAGGNTGAALGNLGRAAAGRYGQDLRIAAMDRAARQQNLQLYGSYLPMDVNLDRTIFSDAYSNALRNKQAGAQMAAAGLQNAMERGITNRFYGPGSQNELLKQEQLAYLQDMRGVAKAQAEFWRNPANYAKYASGVFTPSTPETAAALAAAGITTPTIGTATQTTK